MAFARLLHARPSLAVLDEPVSAVGREEGVYLLELLLQEGISLICTGQLGTTGLRPFSSVVTIEGDGAGSWQSTEIPPEDCHDPCVT